MKVLFLRPEGGEVESVEGVEVINVSVFRPECLKYELTRREVEAIAFTSTNGVRCLDTLPKYRKVYAVGPSTAKAVRERLKVDPLVPDEYTVKRLVDLILRDRTKQVTFFRSMLADDSDLDPLPRYADVEVVKNYTLILDNDKLMEAKELIEDCSVDYVAITSPSIARVIVPYLKDCVKVVSIGPSTSRELSKYNVKFLESKIHTVPGILSMIKGSEK